MNDTTQTENKVVLQPITAATTCNNHDLNPTDDNSKNDEKSCEPVPKPPRRSLPLST